MFIYLQEIVSSSQQTNGELYIPSLVASDSGEYECSYGNDYFEGTSFNKNVSSYFRNYDILNLGETQTEKVKLTVRGMLIICQ